MILPASEYSLIIWSTYPLRPFFPILAFFCPYQNEIHFRIFLLQNSKNLFNLNSRNENQSNHSSVNNDRSYPKRERVCWSEKEREF